MGVRFFGPPCIVTPLTIIEVDITSQQSDVLATCCSAPHTVSPIARYTFSGTGLD